MRTKQNIANNNRKKKKPVCDTKTKTRTMPPSFAWRDQSVWRPRYDPRRCCFQCAARPPVPDPDAEDRDSSVTNAARRVAARRAKRRPALPPSARPKPLNAPLATRSCAVAHPIHARRDDGNCGAWRPPSHGGGPRKRRVTSSAHDVRPRPPADRRPLPPAQRPPPWAAGTPTATTTLPRCRRPRFSCSATPALFSRLSDCSSKGVKRS